MFTYIRKVRRTYLGVVSALEISKDTSTLGVAHVHNIKIMEIRFPSVLTVQLYIFDRGRTIGNIIISASYLTIIMVDTHKHTHNHTHTHWHFCYFYHGIYPQGYSHAMCKKSTGCI